MTDLYLNPMLLPRSLDFIDADLSSPFIQDNVNTPHH